MKAARVSSERRRRKKQKNKKNSNSIPNDNDTDDTDDTDDDDELILRRALKNSLEIHENYIHNEAKPLRDDKNLINQVKVFPCVLFYT